MTLGYVSRPNGLLGAVVVHTDPSMFDVLASGLAVELRLREGAPLRTKIKSASSVRGGVRITLAGVSDRTRAEALVGATVHVEREQLAPLREGEYFDTDLVGLDVTTRDGERLGRLVEVIATGANDVYVVRSDAGAEILVPAVKHAVLDVDLAAGQMTVAPEALEYSAAPAPSPEALEYSAASAPSPVAPESEPTGTASSPAAPESERPAEKK